MNKKNIAVIGAGHLGKIHAKLLATVDGVQPHVVETDPTAREFIESNIGIPTFETTDSIEADLDGAIVVTPTETHFDVCSRLIEQGCNLLVEKPICADAASSRVLCEIAEQNNRVLQVGHVERFNPAFVAARPQLKDVRYWECTRYTPYTFRATDVSVVMDLMIHDIDLVLSAIDSDVLSVRATGAAVVGPHPDVATAWLEFSNGARACLKASRCSPVANRSMQVQTADGMLDVDFAGQSVRRMDTSTNLQEAFAKLSQEEKGVAREEMFQKWLPVSDLELSPQNAILEEQKEFVRCLDGNQSPTVSGRDGLAAVEVAERILAEIRLSSGTLRNLAAA